MYNLLTSFFHPKSPARLEEFETCFHKNLCNSFIKKIYVFYEPSVAHEFPNFLRHEKIHVMNLHRRPMYSDYIKYANAHITNNSINIISNTDIYFDDTLSKISQINMENKLLCISRYNIDENGNYHIQGCGDSYDTWIFRNPLNFVDSDIYIGISGCDTYIAIKALKNDLALMNPCLSIKTYHLHFSEERNNNLDDGYNYWHAEGYDCGFRLPFCEV